MFKNYFKIAWRDLIKSKAYSAINILGPAIGMAVIFFAAWFRFSKREAFMQTIKQDVFCLQDWYVLVDVSLAGCIAIVIAFLTVSYQAIKAAIANPVESLRTE